MEKTVHRKVLINMTRKILNKNITEFFEKSLQHFESFAHGEVLQEQTQTHGAGNQEMRSFIQKLWRENTPNEEVIAF